MQERMSGNAALEELRAMKRPSRRKLDAVKSKHEGTPAWTRTAKKLHAQMVQEGGFLPAINGRASLALMAVTGAPAPRIAPVPGRFESTGRFNDQARSTALHRTLNQARRPQVETDVFLPDVPVIRHPCPSVKGALQEADQILKKAGEYPESDDGCQKVLASVMAVAGLKMVVDNVYADVAERAGAYKEIDKMLKIMAEHHGVAMVCAVSDTWDSMLIKAGLGVAVKCMGANATVSTAVGQYMT